MNYSAFAMERYGIALPWLLRSAFRIVENAHPKSLSLAESASFHLQQIASMEKKAAAAKRFQVSAAAVQKRPDGVASPRKHASFHRVAQEICPLTGPAVIFPTTTCAFMKKHVPLAACLVKFRNVRALAEPGTVRALATLSLEIWKGSQTQIGCFIS